MRKTLAFYWKLFVKVERSLEVFPEPVFTWTHLQVRTSIAPAAVEIVGIAENIKVLSCVGQLRANV